MNTEHGYTSRVMKWANINKPLIIPKITEELITLPFQNKPIDYSKIDFMECIKIGSHIKTFNELEFNHNNKINK